MDYVLAFALGIVALLGLLGAGVERYRRKDATSRLAKVDSEKKLLESENKELSRALEDASTTDFLTGLLNKKGLSNAVEEEVIRSARSGKSMSAIFIDIDDFAAVNEQLGHVDADKVLKEVGLLISYCLNRRSDRAGRFGGDEFVVLLPESDNDWAQSKAQEIRQAIKERFSGRSVTITVSSGVATLQAGEHGDIVNRAGLAMYRAKGDGKDAVASHNLGG